MWSMSTILTGGSEESFELVIVLSEPFAQAGHAPPVRRDDGSSQHSSPKWLSDALNGRLLQGHGRLCKHLTTL